MAKPEKKSFAAFMKDWETCTRSVFRTGELSLTTYTTTRILRLLPYLSGVHVWLLSRSPIRLPANHKPRLTLQKGSKWDGRVELRILLTYFGLSLMLISLDTCWKKHTMNASCYPVNGALNPCGPIHGGSDVHLSLGTGVKENTPNSIAKG